MLLLGLANIHYCVTISSGECGLLFCCAHTLNKSGVDFLPYSERIDKDGLTEAEFLKNYSSDKYPKPSLTADVIIIAKAGDTRQVLLIKRGGHPYLGCWAFPGGFANMGESIEQTAERELLEETGINGVALTPVGFFSKPGRDPRGWVVTRTFLAQTESELPAKAADDAQDARWFDLEQEESRVKLTCGNELIEFSYSDKPITVTPLSEQRMAFDHAEMLVTALKMII
ncbi:MAG: NUDIX hydrolase [Clostridia bacterium]|nr:NUDIX hydrolase [Clostridia bacterium]